MGVLLILILIATSVNYSLQLLLKHFSDATPSCGFYYYLVLSILIMLSLVLFTIAAKQYKLRERERHVNIQAHSRGALREILGPRRGVHERKAANNDDITIVCIKRCSTMINCLFKVNKQ